MEAAQAVDRAFAFYWHAREHPEVLDQIPPGAVVLWMAGETKLSDAYAEAQRTVERDPSAVVVIVIKRGGAEQELPGQTRPSPVLLAAM